MKNNKKKVVIIGKPNVGKSSLFNRIIKNKISIVDNNYGVTRDRIYSYAEWLTKKFLLIDTGGITFEKDKISFADEIRFQTETAILEADIILFVVSCIEGLTEEDEKITKILYKSKKPIILVLNKYDKLIKNNIKIYDFLSFGFGEPIPVSSAHGIGIGDLLDKIIYFLKKINNNKNNIINFSEKKDNFINFCIIGKQNVGKSSLINSILGEKRVIVSNIPGTTTDSVNIEFIKNEKKYNIIDTAGIRKKSKIMSENLEKYSFFRTLFSIEKSDLVLLVIDCTVPISDHDTNIGGIAFNYKKPIILVINKLDQIKLQNKNILDIEKSVRKYFKYLHYCKIVFVSALKKINLNKLFFFINNIYENLKKNIKTSVLNEILVKIQIFNPPSKFKGGKLKIYYITQINLSPIPTFVLFCNNKNYVHFSYKRFIENQIRNYFDFSGIPINIIFRNRK